MSADDDRRGTRRWYPAEMRYVPFPTEKATTAKEACERVAALLNEHLLLRPDMVANAQRSWQGRFRDEFDETWTTYQANLTGLKDSLLLLAGSIGAASSSASFINGQRATMRTEYDATHPVSTAQ